MGRIVVSEFVTLDGVVEAPGGGEGPAGWRSVVATRSGGEIAFCPVGDRPHSRTLAGPARAHHGNGAVVQRYDGCDVVALTGLEAKPHLRG